MTMCKKCGENIVSWQTWHYRGEPYCERCFNQLVHENIQKKKANNE